MFSKNHKISLEEKILKLSDYAKKNSIDYKTAWRHFRDGLIPNARQLPTGTVVIDEPKCFNPEKEPYTIVYARASLSESKSSLDAQADKLESFCVSKGWIVNQIVKEYASGFNDQRPKLLRIFHERKATRLVIESKDRLTRIGFTFIEALLPDCEIIVVNEIENDKDLLEDFISLSLSLYMRIYGRKISKKRIEELFNSLK